MHTRPQTRSGIILIDILAALALGTAFVASIAHASGSARDMFETARERGYALDIYEAHRDAFEGMMPHESRSVIVVPQASSTARRMGTTTISAIARLYGNELIETDISIGADTDLMRRAGPIVFNAVRAHPSAAADAVGRSLCAVDLSNDARVGSYGFQHRSNHPLQLSIVPIMLPIDPHLPLTDIDVRSGIAYISADSAVAGDQDIMVIDIKNADDPSVLSSINTGPGIASIALAGDRVFAAASSAAAQLHIVRFVDLATPVLERKYQLPLPYATATPGFASSIVYDDGLVYLGTEKWVGDEFSIIDIASSTAPVWESGLEMGSKVMDIYVADGMAHVATAGDRQLITVDVSDPSHPDIIDELVPTGWERQEGKVALRFEEEAIFGRTSGGFNIKSDHELFAGAASIDVPGGIYGIVADRFNIFAASRTAGKELIVFDRSLAATSTRPFGLPAMPQAMTCDGDRLYVLAAGAPIIYQITFR